jgi:twitching motility protein PilJ
VLQSFGQSVLIDDSVLPSFLSNRSNTDLQASVLSKLVSEMNSRKIEFATLVGTNKKIILGANNNRTGQSFDPSGIVTDVLTNNRRLAVTVTMTNSEFQMEGAKRWL